MADRWGWEQGAVLLQGQQCLLGCPGPRTALGKPSRPPLPSQGAEGSPPSSCALFSQSRIASKSKGFFTKPFRDHPKTCHPMAEGGCHTTSTSVAWAQVGSTAWGLVLWPAALMRCLLAKECPRCSAEGPTEHSLHRAGLANRAVGSRRGTQLSLWPHGEKQEEPRQGHACSGGVEGGGAAAWVWSHVGLGRAPAEAQAPLSFQKVPAGRVPW